MNKPSITLNIDQTIYELLINIYAETSVIFDVQSQILSKIDSRSEKEIREEMIKNVEMRFNKIIENIKEKNNFDNNLRDIISKL